MSPHNPALAVLAIVVGSALLWVGWRYHRSLATYDVTVRQYKEAIAQQKEQFEWERERWREAQQDIAMMIQLLTEMRDLLRSRT